MTTPPSDNPPPPTGPAKLPPTPPGQPGRKIHNDQYRLAGFLIVAMVSSIGIWHYGSGIEYTGILFIAIPTTMAILLALIPRNTSTYSAFTGTMIAVLSSAIVIREGFICVVMSLPLVIPIAVLAAYGGRQMNDKNRRAAWLIPLALFGAAGDGTVYELPTNITVSETRTIAADASELSDSLYGDAEIPEIQPLLFRLPFPQPTAFTGSGADIGDIRSVEFGDDAAMGELVLEVTERTDNLITWAVIDNTTPVAEWMTIHRATASWVETDDGLDVTMTIEFDRELTPAFYFDPLERWGVGEMAEVLLDMLKHNLPVEA